MRIRNHGHVLECGNALPLCETQDSECDFFWIVNTTNQSPRLLGTKRLKGRRNVMHKDLEKVKLLARDLRDGKGFPQSASYAGRLCVGGARRGQMPRCACWLGRRIPFQLPARPALAEVR